LNNTLQNFQFGVLAVGLPHLVCIVRPVCRFDLDEDVAPPLSEQRFHDEFRSGV